MNERIRLLAEQAGGYVSLSHEHDGKLILSGEDIVQKFAELIVRECISALDKEVYIATREDGEQACHEVILLEHFGVEE
jgi:hypothetical protein